MLLDATLRNGPQDHRSNSAHIEDMSYRNDPQSWINRVVSILAPHLPISTMKGTLIILLEFHDINYSTLAEVSDMLVRDAVSQD